MFELLSNSNRVAKNLPLILSINHLEDHTFRDYGSCSDAGAEDIDSTEEEQPVDEISALAGEA